MLPASLSLLLTTWSDWKCGCMKLQECCIPLGPLHTIPYLPASALCVGDRGSPKHTNAHDTTSRFATPLQIHPWPCVAGTACHCCTKSVCWTAVVHFNG